MFKSYLSQHKHHFVLWTFTYFSGLVFCGTHHTVSVSRFEDSDHHLHFEPAGGRFGLPCGVI